MKLPALISDGIVLQREQKIKIWGWADPGEIVQISFHGAKVRTRTDRGSRWSASFGPFPAGGPYEMEVLGKNRIVVRDVLIGDFWVASGQSNMEMTLGPNPAWNWKGVSDLDKEAADTQYPQLRLFKVHHAVASAPADDVEAETWAASTPDSAGSFSAVAYLFGREIHKRYRVPIGTIETNWGATLAEAWMSEPALRQFPDLHDAIASLPTAIASQEEDRLYLKRRTEWYRQHEREDRGRTDGLALWAQPSFDASNWPTVMAPRPPTACGTDLNGFGGVVWFRKAVNIPKNLVGSDLTLRLGLMFLSDEKYFNRELVGKTQGYETRREYRVRQDVIHEGENVLAIRLDGYRGETKWCTGLYGHLMAAEIGNQVIPLDGEWSYQSGPELADFPVPTPKVLAAQRLPNVPTTLFNAMINPLTDVAVRGVIWYQGEANAIEGRSEQYRKLFPALIADWRQHWDSQFPFLFVQLAGFGRNEEEPAERWWPMLREAQSEALSVPNTAMAVAIDLGEEKNIHPQRKAEVAHRLALSAERLVYNEDVVASGPVYQSMHREGNQVRVKFTRLGGGLLIKDRYGYVRGFEIAGADGRFHAARGRQDGDDVVVFNASVPQPKAVRYDWSNTPDGNVYNREGLPAPPFRSDMRSN